MSTRRIVICGTGTDVGKSYVGCRLAEALLGRGERVLGLKPIESGYARPEESDASALSRAAGHAVITPRYALARPVSPHLAAADEDTEIGLEAICEWVSGWEQRSKAGLCVVETAGGLYSPLSLKHNNLAMAQALEPWRWVLVAPNRLGVLHDVLVALAACEAQDRVDFRSRLAAVVLSSTTERDASTESNRAELQRFVNVPVLEVERGGDALSLAECLY